MFVPIICIALKHNHKGDWTPLFPSNVVIYKHIPISQNTHSEYFHGICRLTLILHLPIPTVNTNISTLLSRIDLDFVEVYETMNVHLTKTCVALLNDLW